MPVPQTDLVRIAADNGCTTHTFRNGAIHVLGTKKQLMEVGAVLWNKFKLSPRTVLSSKTDGVEQPGFPRMEVHPQAILRQS